jgi:ABC-type branched-subunit amino acid transport system ATPase component
MTPSLATRELTKTFGGFRAVDGVSLRLEQGARHALIGPNGAGKTTLVNILAGALRPSSGQVLLEGRDVTSLPTHKRVKRGLSRTFQINQLFPDLTPLQAVALALAEREGLSFRGWRRLDAHAGLLEEATARLERAGLLDVRGEPTRALPYGRQRLLELALAMASEPRILLLDEPAAGVPHGESDQIIARIAALPRTVTVLLIEHDMDLVFRFAERITVLVNGAVLVEGDPHEVERDERVREVYLGQSRDG